MTKGKMDQEDIIRDAIKLVSERCPRIVAMCFWAGTAAIASEELHHRKSFDLDFHTRKALFNTKPLLAELQRAFPGLIEVTQTPDEFGSGFQGILTLPSGENITIEVLSAYEDVSEEDMVPVENTAIMRVSLSRYLTDKMQCIVERSEARDLVDILAVLRYAPHFEEQARRDLASQDALLVAERLLGWTNEEISKDLMAYSDILEEDACTARDLLLAWLKESTEVL